MRFKEQCPECGEWKWCGHPCERDPKNVIEIRMPTSFKVDGVEMMKKPKFDRRAYMRERWRMKKHASTEL